MDKQMHLPRVAVCLVWTALVGSYSPAQDSPPPPPPTPCSTGGECGSSGSTNRSTRNQTSSAHDVAAEAYNAGIHAFNNGDYATALDYYLLASSFFTHDRDTLSAIARTRACIAKENGDYVTALSYYQQALTIQPKRKYLLDNIAWTRGKIVALQGEAAWKSGDIAAAVTYYQQALAYFPESSWRENVVNGTKYLQAKQEDDRREQQADQKAAEERSAGAHIQHDTQDFAHSLRAAPSQGGLEFSNGTPAVALPSHSAKEQLLNCGKETTGLCFDNGRAHDDARVDAGLPDVAEPSAQAEPVDPRVAADRDYREAAMELSKAQAEAGALNRKMARLQEQQKVSPTQERQIEISNLSVQTSRANGAVAIAANDVSIVKQNIIHTFTVIPATGAGQNPPSPQTKQQGTQPGVAPNKQ